MDRFNRIFLLLLGLILVVAGGAGLFSASAQGRELGLRPLEPLGQLYLSVRDTFSADPRLWWSVVIAASVVVALVAMDLAWREIGARKVPRLDTVTIDRGERGRTTLEAVAVADALAADLDRLPGVEGSRARLVGWGATPRMLVRIDLDHDARPSAVRTAAEDAYARTAQALAVPDLDVHTRLRYTAGDTSRRVN